MERDDLDDDLDVSARVARDELADMEEGVELLDILAGDGAWSRDILGA